MTAWQIVRNNGRLELAGELRLADGAAIFRALQELSRESAPALDLDLDRVRAIEIDIVALLVEFRAALAARSIRCDVIGGTPHIRAIVHLYRGDLPPQTAKAAVSRRSSLERLGGRIAELGQHAHQAIAFVGDLLVGIAAVARNPRRGNWRSLPILVERAGADGLVVVVLLNFLVGLVIAFQSMRQLELYGANIYVADIVGVSMTRELAPLLTAIIMTGRSGAAYAAELGTMRVSDEIDALRTMGLSPAAFLVLPRLVALALVAPVLTLCADISGCLGGLVVGVTSLGLSAKSFFYELRSAVVFADVWTGVTKSIAFAIAIGFIGCQQGLSTRGAAAGVGRGTTATVVVSVFAIIVIDTVFTLVFREAGT